MNRKLLKNRKVQQPVIQPELSEDERPTVKMRAAERKAAIEEDTACAIRNAT
jgi:hypothetical protein